MTDEENNCGNPNQININSICANETLSENTHIMYINNNKVWGMKKCPGLCRIYYLKLKFPNFQYFCNISLNFEIP